MRIDSIDDLPQHLQDQARKKIERANNITLPSSHLEPAVCDELSRESDNQKLDTLLHHDGDGCSHRDKDTSSLLDLENDGGGEKRHSGEKKKDRDSREITQYCLHVHSRRNRDPDSGGISDKAAIDGFRCAGLLKDDSRKYIPEENTHTRENCKKGEELTIIEMWEI